MNTGKEPSNMYKTFKSSILFYIYINTFLNKYFLFVRLYTPGAPSSRHLTLALAKMS